MLVKLDEMKNYLRVDTDEDDVLIYRMEVAAEKLCRDIARKCSGQSFSKLENARMCVMYATAYLYEHREEADHRELALTLRALLMDDRRPKF